MSFNVAKALQHRVILLTGSEPALVRHGLDDLISQAGLQKDDYDLEEFSGDSSYPNDWLASVGTYPFLADRRVAVIRNAQKVKPEDVSLSSLQALPETALLIFVMLPDSGDESRSGGKKAGLEKVVTTSGGLVAKFEADPKQISEMLRAEFGKRGKKVMPRTMDLFVEMTGGSYSYALEELEKVVLYSDEDTVSDHTVRTVVVASRDWNVWKMIDALTSGNIQESLRQLQIIMGNKSKVEDIAFQQLFPLVSRQLRLLYQGRICVENNCRPDNLPEKVKALFPAKPNLGGERPFVQGAIMRAAQNLTLEQVIEAMDELSRADSALKGLGTSFSGIDTIERLVFNLSVTLAAKRA